MSSSNDLDSDEKSEFARVNRVMLSKKSDEYRQRRERNNAAVKKSRFKSKQRTIETQRRVEQLKDENAQLERRLETLNREYNLMRSLFIPRRNDGGLRQSSSTLTQGAHQNLSNQQVTQRQATVASWQPNVTQQQQNQ